MTAVRIAGHFGEWFQGRLGSDGPVVLVSLPCAALGVQAAVVPAEDFELDDGGLVGEARARGFLDRLGIAAKGRVTLRAQMPVGGGAGASTAGLLALAQAFGVKAEPQALAQACLATEGAVDPLMMTAQDTRLWASREAREVRQFAALPEFHVLGGFWGAPERTDPSDDVFPDVQDLIPFWDRASRDGDRAALAGIATEGARRTTAARGPEGDPTLDLAREFGALGWCRAHTGSARGVLFAPDGVPAGAAARMRDAGFDEVLVFSTGGAA